jgi:hypothetical protein
MGRPNETRLVNALAIRDTVAVNSGAAPFGIHGFSSGLVVVENGLDQNVTVQVQGKPDGGATWQNEGSSVVANATDVNKVATTTPWSELRVQLTAAGIPTSGTVSAWLTRVKG